MNWDSWLDAKNSLIEATNGRIFVRFCGVTTPSVARDIFSLTVLSMRERPMRN